MGPFSNPNLAGIHDSYEVEIQPNLQPKMAKVGSEFFRISNWAHSRIWIWVKYRVHYMIGPLPSLIPLLLAVFFFFLLKTCFMLWETPPRFPFFFTSFFRTYFSFFSMGSWIWESTTCLKRSILQSFFFILLTSYFMLRIVPSLSSWKNLYH